MKKLLKISFIGVFFLAILAGCTKNEINYGVFTKLTGEEALLKVNYNIAYRANPGVQIKVNGERVSTLINTRYPYPGGGYNTLGDSRPDYLAVKAGSVDVSIVIPKRGTNIDSVELFKTNLITAAGKNYTLHLTDTAANTKSYVTEDDISLPDSGFTKYRFVNLMPGSTGLDLYYGDELLVSNVGYLKSSDYIIKEIKPSAAWRIRESGLPATSTIIATYTSASTLTNRRSYTIFATGYKNQTDAARKPYVSFFLTR